jgi:O-glycosyl hydrolase
MTTRILLFLPFLLTSCAASPSSQSAQVSTADAVSYTIDTQQVQQHWDGWGVSLCWWAGQCGKWEDEKIDEIISWLVSPDGLNYSHFRYNIGGGDDPENRNCELHHMGKGKGLRAEMEGFKDFSGDAYHWERDEAQRKIMLKIREKRPDAVFEAFSNSCPYYMTYSGCVGGNADGGKDNLKPEYYEEFAHYLVDVCKHYKDKYGIEFKTLEPFNESATSYWYQNGSQEGCHFDYQSQIAFLRILAPILRQSGLSTIISASDETCTEQSIEAFEAYQNADVLSLVGQWNTHTYDADDEQRAKLALLTKQAKIPFWMSETGSGGRGLGGNLRLAQRLFDDVRVMQPEAWCDWQYMEEGSDQWCTIRGNFQRHTYRKVKNFYVRQQCTRFIKRGYDIVETSCPQALAAVSPERDTLVLVLLNEGEETIHNISLKGQKTKNKGQQTRVKGQQMSIKAFRTSATEDLASISDGIVQEGSTLSVTLPQQSITTLIINFTKP